MKDQMKNILDALRAPQPQHPTEFPAGMISEYLRVVDEVRKQHAVPARD